MPGLLLAWSESASEAGGPALIRSRGARLRSHQDVINLLNGALSTALTCNRQKLKDAPCLDCGCVFSFSSGNMQKQVE